MIGKAHRLGLQARPSPVKPGETGAAPAAPAPKAAPVAKAPVAPAPVAAPVVAKPAPKRALRAVVNAKPAKTTLLDLSERVCKWPIGHPGDADFHFCGQPSKSSFPYCPEQCLIA